jgi:hypothetical protein
LTFTRDGRDETGSVVIEADISGESTGDLIAAHARQTVPAVSEDLLHAAHELATELSWHGEGIAKALLDSSRRI